MADTTPAPASDPASASVSGAASAPADFSGWTCPAPLRDHERIVMGHGGGGTLSAELVEHLFAPAFGSYVLAELGDSAHLT
ncbi:hydrogenase expression/formation protein HypE, partial [Streptomyces sp. DSM 41527]|nr:hydrogenase expression/formation protein HypE [Streptomyces sp. DSM 41527]